MSSVHIRNVAKRYGQIAVIEDLSIDVRAGEFMVFVGPSGCGKSTLLRMIAGLESFQGGEIAIGGRVVNGVPARDRDIAMVFQDYALYPHMTIEQNMSFGLRMRKTPKDEIRRRVANAAEILQIGHLMDRRPRALSGGQRQRVAMGRAIVREPAVFLFDEPLSNLDAKLRVEVRTEIKRLHQRLGATMVYVTHDQVEAMTMADRIVVLRGGAVEQIGAPQDLYREPATQFVAGFIGSPGMNFLPARIEGDAATLDTGERVPVRRLNGAAPGPGAAGVRPEHIRLAAAGEPCVTAVAEVVEPLGADTLLSARVGGAAITVRLPGEIVPAPGDSLRLTFDPERTLAFDGDGARI